MFGDNRMVNAALDYADESEAIKRNAENKPTEELRDYVVIHRASKARTVVDIATLGLTFEGSTRRRVRIYDDVLAGR